MDKDLIEDQFNKDKITPEIYQFYDGNGRTSEALFANDETKKTEMDLYCIKYSKFTKNWC